MDYQQIPQFSEESLEELTQLLVKFFLKNLPEEALSNLEIEIKFKPSSSNSQALVQESQLLARGGCLQGEGAGCGIGFRWAMARDEQVEE